MQSPVHGSQALLYIYIYYNGLYIYTIIGYIGIIVKMELLFRVLTVWACTRTRCCKQAAASPEQKSWQCGNIAI